MHRILVAILALLIAGLPAVPHLAHAYAPLGAGTVRLAAASAQENGETAAAPASDAGRHLAATAIRASARKPACCGTAKPVRSAHHCSFDLVFLVRGYAVPSDRGSTIYERHAEMVRAFPLHHLLFRPPITA